MCVCVGVWVCVCAHVRLRVFVCYNISTITLLLFIIINRLGYVFWTDYGMKKIERAYLNGTGPPTTVIERGLEQPTGNLYHYVMQ